MRRPVGGLLVGGRSSRMGGIPKQRLSRGGRTFREILHDLLAEVLGEVYVSVHRVPLPGPTDEPPVVIDRFPRVRSSMNGVYSLLAELQRPVLVVPCDMPRITRAVLYPLLERWSAGEDLEGVLYRREDTLEPFPVILSPRLRGGLRERIERDRHGLRAFLKTRDVEVLRAEDELPPPSCPEAFTNVNTPDDYGDLIG